MSDPKILKKIEQENQKYKPKPAVVAVYWILRLIVIGVMVMTIIHKNYESTFVCVLVLILFMLPRFVERNFRIELPSTLEIIILVFIFAAEILGELKSYFITYPHWDSMLHTTTGFISAAFGFALVDLLNRNKAFARTTGSGWTQNATNSVIGRYYMVQFTYNLRRFGKKGSKNISDYDGAVQSGPRRMGPGGPGGPPPGIFHGPR